MSAIEFKQVNKEFQDGDKTLHVLQDVNLKVERGEFVAVIGPSGSGKSTFLTLAGGLQQPTSGEIYINNQLITEYSGKQLNKMRLNDIGFILQASNLVPFLKVKDQFNLFDRIMKDDRKDLQDELLKDLGIEDLKNKFPEDLSGGQRQRVAIAKSLYNNPTLILADEPTASLDSDRAFEVTDILAKESKTKDKAIVMVTHDERLLEKCDRVFKMEDGKLTEK
ncbi:MAG TPA: ABC transporter ATP-binding protein [Alloiococcus sp.]|nr:ABC transporter ATP-binding protein [Alloiococcus sp.]